ncbi:MAG: phospholipase D-like domain-containing protein [Sphingomonadales bacterium]|nr:phospholipase D-like domain-containing protein [Sphingomonadales bacterium]
MMMLWDQLLPIVGGVLAIAIPGFASAHILLTKRDVRSAIGWTGLVWLVPFFGASFYVLFGVNRIRRRAVRVRSETPRLPPHEVAPATLYPPLKQLFPAANEDMIAHAELMNRIGDLTLTTGNRVDALDGGDTAFPAMLEAIAAAKHTVALTSYIFDYDRAGKQFLQALKSAVERGVEVRVLIDSVGNLYSRPRITTMLARDRIPYARFNVSTVPWRMAYMNLRCHRKLLIVDGRTAFTGGMNIREGNYADVSGRSAIRDIQFRMDGPVVAQAMEVFAEDWAFAAGEVLEGDAWYPQLTPLEGATTVARGIVDGPDEDIDKLRWAILSALSMASESVTVVTPYFIPDNTIVAALNQAALKGAEVRIILPETNNLRVVNWASRFQLPFVLEQGCRVFLTPGRFDHSKLMLVDGVWSFFGSTNWDARSLRLNFEFNVECFDPELTRRLEENANKRLQKAREISLDDMRHRPVGQKLRDGIAWLFSPYL